MTALQTQIKDFIATHPLCHGLGSEKSACTIAAINLVLSGRLTDERPDCVCPIIHSWCIPIQDAIPNEMLNNGWSQLVPLIAGSIATPEVEERRRQILLGWMWDQVLPELQPIADKYGFGAAWSKMLIEKTAAATRAAAADAADAAYTADAAAADAAYTAARAAARADATDAADAAYTARAAAADAFWQRVNPTAVLEKLLQTK